MCFTSVSQINHSKSIQKWLFIRKTFHIGLKMRECVTKFEESHTTRRRKLGSSLSVCSLLISHLPVCWLPHFPPQFPHCLVSSAVVATTQAVRHWQVGNPEVLTAICGVKVTFRSNDKAKSNTRMKFVLFLVTTVAGAFLYL